jgi:hypothetical protein
VLFDLIRPMDSVALDLPLPPDDRARRAAEGLLVDCADPRSLVEWGRAVGASDRTLRRALVAGPGLRSDESRTRAQVAGQVGYATTSAFGAAFRRVTGITPGAYFGSG